MSHFTPVNLLSGIIRRTLFMYLNSIVWCVIVFVVWIDLIKFIVIVLIQNLTSADVTRDCGPVKRRIRVELKSGYILGRVKLGLNYILGEIRN